MVKVEGTLEELRALFVEEAKKEARRTAKSAGKKAVKKVVKKAKRAPSAYNKYMKKKMSQLKKKHPRKAHSAIFKQAASSWKRSPERKRSMK